MLWYQEDELILDQRKRQSYFALMQTPTQHIVIEEEKGDFRERCIIIKGKE